MHQLKGHFPHRPMHPRLVRLFLELASHRSPQQSALTRRPTSHRKLQTCKRSSMVMRIGSNSTAVALRQALHWTLSSCKENPLLENLSDPHGQFTQLHTAVSSHTGRAPPLSCSSTGQAKAFLGVRNHFF